MATLTYTPLTAEATDPVTVEVGGTEYSFAPGAATTVADTDVDEVTQALQAQGGTVAAS